MQSTPVLFIYDYKIFVDNCKVFIYNDFVIKEIIFKEQVKKIA